MADQVTDRQWSLFLYEWSIYKEGYDLSSASALYQLYGCMSLDLKQKPFYVTNGKVESKEEIIGDIKNLVVKARNRVLRLVKFMRLAQKFDKDIKS